MSMPCSAIAMSVSVCRTHRIMRCWMCSTILSYLLFRDDRPVFRFCSEVLVLSTFSTQFPCHLVGGLHIFSLRVCQWFRCESIHILYSCLHADVVACCLTHQKLWSVVLVMLDYHLKKNCVTAKPFYKPSSWPAHWVKRFVISTKVAQSQFLCFWHLFQVDDGRTPFRSYRCWL